MLKKYLLYGICICWIALGGCNKDEEKITSPSYADRNWFVIPDKPGEFNQLVYDIYKETGIPIFVNDTLGEEYYALDVAGNPILRTERFNLSYAIFGEVRLQEAAPLRSIVQSRDTPAMIKAAKLLRDKVLPYIPRMGEGSPCCYFLVDTIILNPQDILVFGFGNAAPRDTIKNISPVYSALKGVVVGGLNQLNEMPEDELDLWCGRVIAAKVTSWLLSNNVDLTSFTGITVEDKMAYNQKQALNSIQYKLDLVEASGMFYFYHDNPDKGRATLTQDRDMIEYIARVYAYRGREQEFLKDYDVDSKVYRKFQIMKAFVDFFEERNGLK